MELCEAIFTRWTFWCLLSLGEICLFTFTNLNSAVVVYKNFSLYPETAIVNSMLIPNYFFSESLYESLFMKS